MVSDVAAPDDPSKGLRELSDGAVVAAPPSGPVFAKPTATRRRARSDTFVPAVTTRKRVLVGVLTASWVVALAVFWVWWLQPSHAAGAVGLWVNSALLAYLGFLPLYFIVSANRLRRVNPELAIPPLRVALVVTRAPSEDWTLVKRTVEAMLDQTYPHDYDVWLCDESPTAEIRSWCARHGVNVSCRQGDSEYHRSTWPRRTRCKEGNLAYFYDRFGYRDYDVVSQLDSDHVPGRTYLAEMVRPFADPAVGYVAAPSVCDANADLSWSARGRLHREGTFHGPLQLGHNDDLGPICIGSHYAVRTEALRSIGGIGPELAEDFSTSYLLNVAGWTGAFAIDAPARGDGPLTFGAMLTQEFQWSRSLFTVFLGLVPRTIGALPWRLRFRFLFSLSYYPLLAFSTTVGLLLPPIAAVTGLPWVRVSYAGFLAHWLPIAACLLLLTLVLRNYRLLRPVDAPIISWEMWLYTFAGWPVICWGLIAAVLQQVFPRPIDFKVTPKGVSGPERLPVRLVAPYLVISLVLSCAAILGIMRTGAIGYIGLCLIGSTTYAVVAISVSVLHVRESARLAGDDQGSLLALAGYPLAACTVTVLPLLLALTSYPGYLTREFG